MGANRSFWESELYDRKYDLAVIGGGLTGQSTALFFKERYPEAKVLILDRGFYPLGASSRNAGFACFGSPTEHMDDLSIEKEEKIIDRIRRRMSGLQLLRKVLGDENIGYREDGAYEIFTDEAVYASACEHISRFNRWVEEVGGLPDTYEPATFQKYPAVTIKGEGSLHPGKMMRELYHRNLGSGIEFRWNTRVSAIDSDRGLIRTEGGHEVSSSNIMLATNAFTSALLPELHIQPCRGYVIVSKPISGLKWKGTFHHDKGYYYFRNIGDRFLIGGARNTDKDNEYTDEFGRNEAIRSELIRFTNEVVGLSRGWEIENEWSGIMGFTKTKSPMLTKAGDCTVAAVGLSGMGIALGMQLGKEATELLD